MLKALLEHGIALAMRSPDLIARERKGVDQPSDKRLFIRFLECEVAKLATF